MSLTPPYWVVNAMCHFPDCLIWSDTAFVLIRWQSLGVFNTVVGILQKTLPLILRGLCWRVHNGLIVWSEMRSWKLKIDLLSCHSTEKYRVVQKCTLKWLRVFSVVLTFHIASQLCKHLTLPLFCVICFVHTEHFKAESETPLVWFVADLL